jgi:hypothetical protein
MRRLVLISLFTAFAGFHELKAQPPGTVEFSALGAWHNWTRPFNARYGFGGGTRLGIWLPAGFQVEGQLDLTFVDHWSPGTGFTLAHYGGSLIFNTRPADRLHVYARAGLSLIDSMEDCATNPSSCGSLSTMTGALGFRVRLAGPLHLRAESMIRRRPLYDYTSFGASVGVTVLLKQAVSDTTSADDDSDGVPNRRDRCPATPKGALVDARGCPADHDGDGVFDGIDRCPGTPRNTVVDAVGCPVRSPEGLDGQAR